MLSPSPYPSNVFSRRGEVKLMPYAVSLEDIFMDVSNYPEKLIHISCKFFQHTVFATIGAGCDIAGDSLFLIKRAEGWTPDISSSLFFYWSLIFAIIFVFKMLENLFFLLYLPQQVSGFLAVILGQIPKVSNLGLGKYCFSRIRSWAFIKICLLYFSYALRFLVWRC